MLHLFIYQTKKISSQLNKAYQNEMTLKFPSSYNFLLTPTANKISDTHIKLRTIWLLSASINKHNKISYNFQRDIGKKKLGRLDLNKFAAVRIMKIRKVPSPYITSKHK